MSINQSLDWHLHAKSSAHYQKIWHSQFVQTILSGRLPRARFCHYLQQDALYLAQEAQILHQLAQRAPTRQEGDFFLAMSLDCINIETQMQNSFFARYHITADTTIRGVFAQYLDFLCSQAQQPFGLAIFAYFPCYYLYAQLGKAISDYPKTPNNLYQSYIDTYAGEPYKYFVDRYFTILEKHFQLFTEAEKKISLALFERACHFEAQIFQEA